MSSIVKLPGTCLLYLHSKAKLDDSVLIMCQMNLFKIGTNVFSPSVIDTGEPILL